MVEVGYAFKYLVSERKEVDEDDRRYEAGMRWVFPKMDMKEVKKKMLVEQKREKQRRRAIAQRRRERQDEIDRLNITAGSLDLDRGERSSSRRRSRRGNRVRIISDDDEDQGGEGNDEEEEGGEGNNLRLMQVLV